MLLKALIISFLFLNTQSLGVLRTTNSKITEGHCAKSEQCDFGAPFHAIRADSMVDSRAEANSICEAHGATLARLSNDIIDFYSIEQQHKMMTKTCKSLGHTSCWTGGIRKSVYTNDQNADNTEWIFPINFEYSASNSETDDVNNLIFSSNRSFNMQKYGIYMWAEKPADRDGNARFEPDHFANRGKEDCLVLYQAQNYDISDFPCQRNRLTNLVGVLCNNPGWKPDRECECNCNRCHVSGDPHIETFDGLYYHSMGNCSYSYVTSCANDENNFNSDLPIDVVGSHEECFSTDATCLKALYVTFYTPFGNIATMIKLGHSLINNTWFTTVNFVDDVNHEFELDLNGLVPLNTNIYWFDPNDSDYDGQNDEAWAFRINEILVEGVLIRYELAIWTYSEYQAMRIEFNVLNQLDFNSLYLSEANIWAWTCFFNQACGLCGRYDGNQQNDFTVRRLISDDEENWFLDKNGQKINSIVGQPDYNDTYNVSGVESIKNTDAFLISQIFSQSWATDNQAILEDNQISNTQQCSIPEACPVAPFENLCPRYCDCNNPLYPDTDSRNPFVRVYDPPESEFDDDKNLLLNTCSFDMCYCFGDKFLEHFEYIFIGYKMCIDRAYLRRNIKRRREDLQQCEKSLRSWAQDNQVLHCIDIKDNSCCSQKYCGENIPLQCLPNPTMSPTISPSNFPSLTPTEFPTKLPTKAPSKSPSATPSKFPSNVPTKSPSKFPTEQPTKFPTAEPTTSPTSAPTYAPTAGPTASPSLAPTDSPTTSPTQAPTNVPSETPSKYPTKSPSKYPSKFPTNDPTESPTFMPTVSPTAGPTSSPTDAPTTSPSMAPTSGPTGTPTSTPTSAPTNSPTTSPTSTPTSSPTSTPTGTPTSSPTAAPTESPTTSPTTSPTSSPTESPTNAPTLSPIAFYIDGSSECYYETSVIPQTNQYGISYTIKANACNYGDEPFRNATLVIMLLNNDGTIIESSIKQQNLGDVHQRKSLTDPLCIDNLYFTWPVLADWNLPISSFVKLYGQDNRGLYHEKEYYNSPKCTSCACLPVHDTRIPW